MLSIYDGPDTLTHEAVLDKLTEITDYGDVFEVEEHSLRSGDSCKWYDHDEDMVKLSRAFPEVTFELHGEGEEAGDLWNSYYRNGLVQFCRSKVTYPPFDPDKLTDLATAVRQERP